MSSLTANEKGQDVRDEQLEHLRNEPFVFSDFSPLPILHTRRCKGERQAVSREKTQRIGIWTTGTSARASARHDEGHTGRAALSGTCASTSVTRG
jgi:hypothetical protein